MKPFQLTGLDGNTYTLNDADGSVIASSGDPVGTWSTDSTNTIIINKPDGTTITTINAKWSFNANQLCLADSAGNLVANFGLDNPEYSLLKNVLVVTPGDSATWTFSLYCKWSLDASNNLGVNFGSGGTGSTITGYVQNSTTQFVFWFVDSSLALPTQQMLGFNGAWVQADAANDPLKLVFQGKVDDGSAGGLPFKFSLANTTTTINPDTNNLELSYSDANGVHKMILQGSLAISSSAGITFSISDQTDDSGGVVVEKRDLKIAGTFDFSSGFTSLQFNVSQTIGGPSPSLTIGGAFQAQLGTTGLQINFTYQSSQCPTCGNGRISSTMTLAVNGTFTWSAGKIYFSYSDSAGNVRQFEVKAEIHFGKIGIDTGILIKNDPIAGRCVTAFAGISW